MTGLGNGYIGCSHGCIHSRVTDFDGVGWHGTCRRYEGGDSQPHVDISPSHNANGSKCGVKIDARHRMSKASSRLTLLLKISQLRGGERMM